MELLDYYWVLWGRKWLVIFTTLVTAATVAVGTVLTPPRYTAVATLRVMPSGTNPVDYVDYLYLDRLANSYLEIAQSKMVLDEATQTLGLDRLPDFEVEIVPETDLLRISVEDADPALAQEVANTLATILLNQGQVGYTSGTRIAQEILSEELTRLEEELDELRAERNDVLAQIPVQTELLAALSRDIEMKEQTRDLLLESYNRAHISQMTSTLSIVETATTPTTPSGPHILLVVVLGTAVGLAGGAAVSFITASLNPKLYTSGQIEAVTALPVIGRIPHVGRRQQPAILNGHSPQAEAFRHLRTNVFSLTRDAGLRTLLVTSAESGDGKSTVVAGLAFSIAQAGQKVIAIDGDLRRPTLGKIFDLANNVGLSSVLTKEVTLTEAIQSTEIPGLQLLTSGPLSSNPAELLGLDQMTAVVEQLRQQFEVVLLDTPAFLAVADAAVLASFVDGVVLVVERTKSSQDAVIATCKQLASVKATVVGLVVNRSEQSISRRYFEYYRQPTTEQIAS